MACIEGVCNRSRERAKGDRSSSTVCFLTHCTHCTHCTHSPFQWDRPDEFDPDRAWNAAAYRPFGGAPRDCLGRNFARLELKIILSLLLRNFAVSLPTPEVPVKQACRITRASDTGVWLVVEQRATKPADKVSVVGSTVQGWWHQPVDRSLSDATLSPDSVCASSTATYTAAWSCLGSPITCCGDPGGQDTRLSRHQPVSTPSTTGLHKARPSPGPACDAWVHG